jgi:hypothetical protein
MHIWNRHRARGARLLALWAGIALALPLAGCLSSDGTSTPSAGQRPDPVMADFPVAYVKRPAPAAGAEAPDVRELLDFQPGGDLYLRTRASPSAPERNLTGEITGGKGDVRDVEPSFDGAKLIFSMRLAPSPGADPDDPPTWNIWEYDDTTQTLRRVIPSDLVAEEGHDLAPHYLPDGRIVFTSTRQRQSRAILLDEGKPQFAAQDESGDEPAFVLHVMNADGSGIHQISFNQSHDFDPSLLADGRIVFSRWDRAPGHDEISLYAMRPDGTDMELLYGAQSHDTGTDASTIQFLDPRMMENGHLLVRAQPFAAPDQGGDLWEIDVADFVENAQPTAPNTGVLSGPAQKPATANVVHTVDGPSPGGRFSSAFPLFDGSGRILVSWTQCRLLEGTRIVPCTDKKLGAVTAVTAAPLYGLWIYDPVKGTQLPVADPVEGVFFTDIVALQPRKLPPLLLDRVAGVDFDAEFETEGVGILDIRSVYDVDGRDTAAGGIAALADPRTTLAPQRPARFLRIEKPVGLPDRDTLDFRRSAFGVTSRFGMRELLGYAPIEPDGSVRVKVPANVPFAITIVDANGRRIGPRHENWLQVRPGQELKCNGCHDPESGLSHGRSNLFKSAYAGAPVTGLPFPNTNPAFFANAGETMAQVRARISCQTDCASLVPSNNLIYKDVWTDPVAAGRPADAAFDYNYADLGTPAPTSSDCIVGWRSGCRVTIHYERHIHPLWSKPRITLAADGTVLADDTCTTCHSNRSAAGAVQLPAGQLELTDGPSSDQPDHFQAYRELLATDNEQELVNGVLQDKLVQVGVDPVTGAPQFAGIPVPPSLRAGNANRSVAFFALFAPAGSHAGRLTPAELKLVSEWVDSGAQYFNDPFAAPLN